MFGELSSAIWPSASLTRSVISASSSDEGTSDILNPSRIRQENPRSAEPTKLEYLVTNRVIGTFRYRAADL